MFVNIAKIGKPTFPNRSFGFVQQDETVYCVFIDINTKAGEFDGFGRLMRSFLIKIFPNVSDPKDLGSGLIDHNQKMTAAAMAMAEKKVWAHRS